MPPPTTQLRRFQMELERTAGAADELAAKSLRVSAVAHEAQLAFETPRRIEEDIDAIGDKLEKMKLVLRTTDKVGPLKAISNVLIDTLDAVKRASDQMEGVARSVRQKIENTGVIDKLEDMQSRLNGFADDATLKAGQVRGVRDSAAGFETSLKRIGDPATGLARATEDSVRPPNDAAQSLNDAWDNDGGGAPRTPDDDIEDRLEGVVRLVERANFSEVIGLGNDFARIKELICVLEEPLDLAYAALKPVEPLLDAADALLSITIQPVLDFVLEKLGLQALMNRINAQITALLPDVAPLEALDVRLPEVSADLDEFLFASGVALPNFEIDDWLQARIPSDLVAPLNRPGAATALGTVFGPDRDDHIIGDDRGGGRRNLRDIIDPGDGDDLVEAGAGDDVILGSEGDDEIFGGAGDGDRLVLPGDFFEYVFEGQDTDGDGRNDLLVVTHTRAERGGDDAGVERVHDDVEFIFFEQALEGFESRPVADLLTSRLARAGETLVGENGRNDYLFALGPATLKGRGGDDYLGGSTGADVLEGGRGDDTLAPLEGADTVRGGRGRDTFIVSPDEGGSNIEIDLADGSSWFGRADQSDAIFGIEDLLSFNTREIVRLRGADGANAITIPDSAGAQPDNVNGGGGRDIIDTGAGDDVIVGGAGNDIVRAGAGDDVMLGGARARDSDRYEGGPGRDLVSYAVDLRDTLRNDSSRRSNIDQITAGGPNASSDFGARAALIVDAAAGLVSRLDASGREVGQDTLVDVERIRGGDGDDVLYGRPSVAPAGGGDFEIDGGKGDDVLHARRTDRVAGGDGDDRIHLDFDRARKTFTSVDGGSNDTFLIGSDRPLDDGAGDRAYLNAPGVRWLLQGSVSQVRAQGFLTLEDRALDGLQAQGEPSEVYVGVLSDVESFFLGRGDDQFSVRDSSGILINAGRGDDVLQGERLTGAAKFFFSGGRGDDRLFASDAAVLDGGPGDDRIATRFDFDLTAFGGPGDDVVELFLRAPNARKDVRGGDEKGDDPQDVDTIIVDADPANLGTNAVRIRPDPSGGPDALLYGLVGDGATGSLRGFERIVGSDNPAAGDDIVLTRRDEEAFGQAGDDRIHGRGGDDVIYGGLGRDMLLGGGGDDLLHAEGVDEELRGGRGNDTASFASAFPVYVDGRFREPALREQTATVESLSAKWIDLRDGLVELRGGRSADELLSAPARPGPRELVSVENVYGSEGGDVIRGDGGDNVLSGAGGDDFLFGGAGDDTLLPGAGDDTVNGGPGADRIVIGEGSLTIRGGDGRDIIDFGATPGVVTYDFATGAYTARLTVTAPVWLDTGTRESRSFDTSDGRRSFTPQAVLEADASFADSPDDAGRTLPLRPATEDEAALDAWRRSRIEVVEETPVFRGAQSGVEVVAGGAGTTRLLPSDGIDRFNGTGTPDDVLVLRGLGNGVRYDLATGEGSARALRGDSFRGIDAVEGTGGRDVLAGASGGERLEGFGGDDRIIGRGGPDRLLGGGGDDDLKGGGGADLLRGHAGGDALAGGRGTDRLFGNKGWDVLKGGGGRDDLIGGGGADRLHGHGGGDSLTGGGGRDRLFGDKGSDTLKGGGGDDELAGGGGADRLRGDAGADALDGGTGRDRLFGGGDADRLRGGDGADSLSGGSGRDALHGEAQEDRLLGGKGQDRLFGDAGADVLQGQRGHDRLHGGDGADSFVFRRGDGHDEIRDWHDGVDQIVFRSGASNFRALDINQNGRDALIAYGDGDQITLHDAQAGDLDRGDFAFA